jgi:hypothetical protein
MRRVRIVGDQIRPEGSRSYNINSKMLGPVGYSATCEADLFQCKFMLPTLNSWRDNLNRSDYSTGSINQQCEDLAIFQEYENQYKEKMQKKRVHEEMFREISVVLKISVDSCRKGHHWNFVCPVSLLEEIAN